MHDPQNSHGITVCPQLFTERPRKTKLPKQKEANILISQRKEGRIQQRLWWLSKKTVTSACRLFS